METLLQIGAGMVGSLISGSIKKHGTPLPNNAIPFTNPALAAGLAWKLSGGDVGTTAAVTVGSIGATVIHQLGKRGLKAWRKRQAWNE